MTYIETVGNLKLFYEYNAHMQLTIYAINGTDIVGSATFYATPNHAKACVARVLSSQFDTYTLSDIRSGLMLITPEYNGKLLSGKIAGFDGVEYFKQIDDTRFYKHFTKRPMM